MPVTDISSVAVQPNPSTSKTIENTATAQLKQIAKQALKPKPIDTVSISAAAKERAKLLQNQGTSLTQAKEFADSTLPPSKARKRMQDSEDLFQTISASA